MNEFNFISLAQKAMNAFIDDTFIDEDGNPVPDTGDSTDPLTAFKNSLKINDDDSIHYVTSKMLLAILGTGYINKAIGREFYGTPKTDFKQFYQVQPQLKFYFVEPERNRIKRNARNPKRMQFSIALRARIEDINDAYLSAITSKINAAFPKPNTSNDLIFLGTSKYSYYDPDNGYQLKGIQSANQSQAIDFIKSALQVADTAYESHRLTKTDRVGDLPDDSNKKMVTGYVALFKVIYINPQNRDDVVLVYRPLLDLSDIN
jgi:hypothetical protein